MSEIVEPVAVRVFSKVATLKVEHLDCAGGYLHIVNGKVANSALSYTQSPSQRLWKPILSRNGRGSTIFEDKDNGHISTR